MTDDEVLAAVQALVAAGEYLDGLPAAPLVTTAPPSTCSRRPVPVELVTVGPARRQGGAAAGLLLGLRHLLAG